MSLLTRITHYARERPYEWISGETYERLAMSIGKKASNCGRRLRELHTKGILERRIVGGHVEYHYIQRYPIPKDFSQVNKIELNPIPEKKVEAKQGSLIPINH